MLKRVLPVGMDDLNANVTQHKNSGYEVIGIAIRRDGYVFYLCRTDRKFHIFSGCRRRKTFAWWFDHVKSYGRGKAAKRKATLRILQSFVALTKRDWS